MQFDLRRIAPGKEDTSPIEIYTDQGSVRYSTRYPKQPWSLAHKSRWPQAWRSRVDFRRAAPVETTAHHVALTAALLSRQSGRAEPIGSPYAAL